MTQRMMRRKMIDVISAPAVPCNQAYCIGFHRFRSANSGGSDRRTSSGVVGLGESLTTSFVDVFVIARLLETETAVSCNDNHCVRHALLHAALIDELCEVAMDIATHHKAFGVGEVKDVLFHTTLLHQICLHAIDIHIPCRLDFLGRTPSGTP